MTFKCEDCGIETEGVNDSILCEDCYEWEMKFVPHNKRKELEKKNESS